MEENSIQERINELDYSDAAVLRVSCDYFADEVSIEYEDLEDGNVLYHFVGCYEVKFKHYINLDKIIPVKEMNYSQIPYFLTEVIVDKIELEGESFYKCNITMSPLLIEIVCKNIEVGRCS